MGVEYQQGPLYRTNLRTAVLQRDGRKCVYCGRSGKRQPLELDHVVPKSHGGTDRYDNLVAACRTCNQQRGNQTLEQWLKRRPKKLAEIEAKLGMELADATHMNVILPRLLQALRNDGWTVVEHSAASTAAGRRLCSVEKSHHGDAAMTGCPTKLRYIPTEPITINAKGRGNRQRIMPDQYGTPKGAGLPGILPATQAHPAADPYAGSQEAHQARSGRCHRRLRKVRPSRKPRTGLRCNQPPAGCPDQPKMEKRQG